MALILVTLGLLGVAVVAVAWWPLPDVLGGQDVRVRPATATVVEPAPCGTSTRGDLVEVRVDGKTERARFDGCGHTRGQRLQVLVPEDPGAELVVQPAPADSGTAKEKGDLTGRVSWVLLTLSAVAGGGYVLMLRSGPPSRVHSTSAGAADQVLH